MVSVFTGKLMTTYALLSMLAMPIVVFAAFRQSAKPTTLDEITVQRINVVEKDGTTRLVISNRERAPEPVVNGRSIASTRGKVAGVIFYNDEGDERGGLVYSNNAVSLTFDQFRQDQAVGLMLSEDGSSREGGLYVWDRPDFPIASPEWDKLRADEQRFRALPPAERERAIEKMIADIERSGEPTGANRVFVGKNRSRNAVVALNDGIGRPRLRLTVTPQGEGSIEFLDARGTVTERWPRGVTPPNP